MKIIVQRAIKLIWTEYFQTSNCKVKLSSGQYHSVFSYRSASKGKQLGAIERSFLLGLWLTNDVGFQLTKEFSGKKIMRFNQLSH